MTTHIRHELRQIVAAEDLSGVGAQFKAVTLDGTICQAASNKKFAGILWHGGVSSAFVSVAYDGLSKAYVGAAVSTVGFPLKVANSGFLVPANSGDPFIARLDDALASSGDIARIHIDVFPSIFGG